MLYDHVRIFVKRGGNFNFKRQHMVNTEARATFFGRVRERRGFPEPVGEREIYGPNCGATKHVDKRNLTVFKACKRVTNGLV